MKIRSLKELEFITKLFDLKEGTLKQLRASTGIYGETSNQPWLIKDQLISDGILLLKCYESIGKGNVVAIYKINHKRILSALVKDNSCLKILLEKAQKTIHF